MNNYNIWQIDGKMMRIQTDFTLTDFLRFIKDEDCKIFDDKLVNFKYVTSIYKYESK